MSISDLNLMRGYLNNIGGPDAVAINGLCQAVIEAQKKRRFAVEDAVTETKAHFEPNPALMGLSNSWRNEAKQANV